MTVKDEHQLYTLGYQPLLGSGSKVIRAKVFVRRNSALLKNRVGTETEWEMWSLLLSFACLGEVQSEQVSRASRLAGVLAFFEKFSPTLQWLSSSTLI